MSPSRKPNMEVILGIGKKPSREEAPPPFGGKPPVEEAEESAGGEGMCSVMCPKCGEAMQLQVIPAMGAEPTEEPVDLGQAG